MKKTLGILAILLISLLVAVQAHEESEVVVLTNDNFDDVISKNPSVLVEFYAPWCGHCKKLAPEYEKVAVELKGTAVVAKVDATVEEALRDRFGIQGYPTIKFFKNGQLHSDYDKERTVKAFVDFVKKKSGPAYTTIQDQGAWNAFIGETALTHIVAFLPAGDNAAFLETYEKIASSPDFDGFSFGYVSDESLTTSLSQKANVIAIYRNGELESVYSDTLTNEGITAYLNKNGFPLLEKLDMSQSFIQRSVKRQVPLLIIFRGGEEAELKEQYDFAKKVAETNELRVSVLESEASAYPNLVSQWGASGQKFPTAILVKFQGKGVEIKAYDEEKELTVESVLSWAQSCVDGKACPTFLKSEPIPETEEPVKVVVGRTFESIVFDTTKDVLLEIYSPTCPHCKAVVKPYTELAERYANDEKVVIAKIDGTKNSLPDSVNVRGYPTFLLFKASDKANPITYSKGERTLENFVDFIEENRAPKGDDNKNVKDEL